MSFKELVQERDRHQAESKRLMSEIQAAILALPDNPRIKRLPGSPHCFIISSKSLGNNWTVEHHDFKKQYELVAAELVKADDPVARLHAILAEGKIKLSSAYHHMVTLHEDVIDNLSKMLGIRWKSIAEWPAGKFPSIGDRSEDTHDTRSSAQAVCNMLRRDGFGGEGKVFPARTRVEVAS